ncbi:MAG: hypothetical protein AAB368_00235, partial [bacterium]
MRRIGLLLSLIAAVLASGGSLRAEDATSTTAVAASDSSASVTTASTAPEPVAPAQTTSVASDDDEGITVTPFYSFDWLEGAAIQSVGSWFFGSNYGTSLGAKAALTPEHALFGVYDLSYSGPGLRYQEGREFGDRTIDHNALLEYQYSGFAGNTIKTRVLFIKELRRSGPSEVFGSGLYDFWALGGGVLDDIAVRPGLGLGVGVTYQYFRFPNYSDLLAEFTSAGSAAALGGMYDYHNIRTQVDAKFKNRGRSWVAVTVQQYVHARVKRIVAPFGDSKEKQRDLVGELGGSWLFTPASGPHGRGSVPPAV